MKLRQYISYGIAVILLALLCVPMIQGGLNLWEEKPLDGAYNAAPESVFSWESWFEGSWQDQIKKYANFHVGFHSDVVRIDNQLQYSLFNKTNVEGVVIGKEGWLFEEGYIHALTGKDFIGTDSLKSIGRGLNQVRDTLAKRNIELLVVMAPGKGYFHQEYIPDYFDLTLADTTNFEVVIDQLEQYNIEYMNCRSWFEAMKDTSIYPLYPKNGIHWSRYAEFIFADSLLNRLEHITGNRYPRINVHSLEVTDQSRFTDDDIEKGMNLMYELPDDSMAYPGWTIEIDPAVHTQKVLTIADSYYWDLYNLGLSNDVFNNSEFWYYCAAVYPESKDEIVTVWDINYVERMEQNDAVVLICTDANLHRFPFGLIKQMRQYFEMPYVPKAPLK
ncbi:MAG: hypothetical protein ACJAU0_001582 [Flavobacteriales bacterium]|jgi:hypothetical protein